MRNSYQRYMGLLLVCACAGTNDLQNVGFTVEGRERSVSRKALAPTRLNAAWSYAEAFRTLVAVEGKASKSQGHNPGVWQGTVWVSPGLEGHYAYEGRRQQFWPEGGMVAEKHTTLTGDAGPAFVMMKTAAQADGWLFAIVSSDGRGETLPEKSLCARCHAEAPGDSLFGSAKN